MNETSPRRDGHRERQRKSANWAVVVTVLIVSGLMMLGAIWLVVRSGKL